MQIAECIVSRMRLPTSTSDGILQSVPAGVPQCWFDFEKIDPVNYPELSRTDTLT